MAQKLLDDIKKSVEVIEPLRDRGELERVLATQIAVGAIKSLEEAEDAGHVDALEYCAQMLFDGVRSRIAEKEKLPKNIVQHLLKDRITKIRYKVLINHWQDVDTDVFNNILMDASNLYATNPGNNYFNNATQNTLNRLFEKIMRHYFECENDKMFHKLLIIKGSRKGFTPDIVKSQEEKLRNMPRTHAHLYQDSRYLNIMQLVHPDQEVRFEAVKKVLELSIGELRSKFQEYDYDKHTIKTKIYKLIAQDQDVKIRRLLLKGMNCPSTLLFMSETDPNALLASQATMKLDIYTRRAAYAKKYHERKRNDPTWNN